MEQEKKLFTVLAKYEASIPVGTVLASNEEEALMLAESIPLSGLELCIECQKIFGEGDIEEFEVEEVEVEKIIAPIIEIIESSKTVNVSDSEVEKITAGLLGTSNIQITESTSFAGCKRSFKVTEVTPLNKENEDIPDHIKPYMMSQEEINKDKEDKEKAAHRPYYESYMD